MTTSEPWLINDETEELENLRWSDPDSNPIDDIIKVYKWYGEQIGLVIERVKQAYEPVYAILDELTPDPDLFKSYNCPQHGSFLLKDHCPLCRRTTKMQSRDSTKSKQNWSNSGPRHPVFRLFLKPAISSPLLRTINTA